MLFRSPIRYGALTAAAVCHLIDRLRVSPIHVCGGEGRTRTFEAARATDLQSAAFDRFATSPKCLYLEYVVPAEPTRLRRSHPIGAGEGI